MDNLVAIDPNHGGMKKSSFHVSSQSFNELNLFFLFLPQMMTNDIAKAQLSKCPERKIFF